MKNILSVAIATVVGFSFSGFAMANTNSLSDINYPSQLKVKKSKEHYRKPTPFEKQIIFVQKSTQNRVIILRTFKTSIKGLTGFVLEAKEKNSHPIIAYVNKDATYMVVGAVLNKNGLNLNYQYTQKYVSSIASRAAYNGLSKTFGFVEGSQNAPHKINVVADPNCIYCHDFYRDIQPFIKNGSLAVNWILVGVISPTSNAKAAAILNAKNPIDLLEKDEVRFDVQNESGGIHGAAHISNKIESELQANKKYMFENNFVGTPVLIFKSKGNPKVISGYINSKQFNLLLPSIGSSF